MSIVGHGIDIVEIERIGRLAEMHGEHFLTRIFTPAEQRYCADRPKRYYEHLAGRFAAKEAILKVLGTGWAGGIAWCDMEILPDARGKPVLSLSGQCLLQAQHLGIDQWHISISHIATHAVASAIGVCGG